MKILIIDDHRDVAELMKMIIADFGEVEVCSRSRSVPSKMMPKELVIEKLEPADLILIDQDLGTDYKGTDLLPYCSDKKIVGISSDTRMKMGPINFHNKRFLRNDSETKAELRHCVQQAIQ